MTGKGFTGEVLFVNLATGCVDRRPTRMDYAQKLLGGSGYASMLFYNLTTDSPSPSPFSPQNPLIFMTGPATGTLVPCSGRHVVCSRSPLTGYWGEANSGGHFGAELKSAGLDGIVITGRSDEPAIVSIDHDDVEIQDGADFWGLNTGETQKRIQRILPHARVACIGPAGEKLVRFAGIVNEERIAARCGLGAIMGSKRLKAIAVRGSSRVGVFDIDGLHLLRNSLSKSLQKAHSKLRDEGTAMYVERGMLLNDMPVRYFQEADFETSDLNATTLCKYLTGRIACHQCPIGCGRKVSIQKFGLNDIAGPEFQTIAALGTNLKISDLNSVIYMNYLCNQYGIDTISLGSTIAFATYLDELGVTSNGLVWGNSKSSIDLIHSIARREGIGEELAEGSMRYAEKHDVREMALHVKGLEVPNHDPRAFAGMAAVYAMASRGASHTESDVYAVDINVEYPELGIVSGDRLSDIGKGETAARLQDFRTFCDSFIICHFPHIPVQSMIRLVQVVTGFTLNPDDILRIGVRSVNIKRLVNLRFGLNPSEDCLPKGLLKPLNGGLTDCFVPDLELQKSDYYRYREWDIKTGHPRKESFDGLPIHIP